MYYTSFQPVNIKSFSSVLGQNPQPLEVQRHSAANRGKFVSGFMGAIQLTAECRGLVGEVKHCCAAEEEADLTRTISMSWYCSHYRAVKWVEPELWQGQVDRHQEKQIRDFIPLCHMQWKFKSCCRRALWRALTPAFKVLAWLAETQWPLQLVAWRLRSAWHGGTASISAGKLAQIFLAWGDPAQQCTWSGQEQVSRLCAMPLGVLMDIRIIWHVFKGRKCPRQSCSFTRGYERRHFYNHKSNPKQILKL